MSKLWLLLGLLLVCGSVSALDKSDYLTPPVEVGAGLFEGYAVHIIKNPLNSSVNLELGNNITMYQLVESNAIRSYKMQVEHLWNETINYEVITNCTYIKEIGEGGNYSWEVDTCTTQNQSYNIPHNDWIDVYNVSLKNGEQKKIKYVFRWNQTAFVKPVKVDYIPALVIGENNFTYPEYLWFNASCGKRQNFSMSVIYGTDSVNITLSGNSTINPSTSFNNSNFTFTDSQNTKVLGWFVDYINSSGSQANQQIQFFVNISNNDTIWMYYDCNFLGSQETRTTGKGGGVIQAYYNLDDGLQGWSGFQTGGCSLVNDTIYTSHGNRMGNQMLNMSVTSVSGGCTSPILDFFSANGTNNLDFFNIEWLGSRRGGGSSFAYFITLNTNWPNNDGSDQLFSKITNADDYENFGSGSWVTLVSPPINSLSKFARLRIRANWSATGDTIVYFSANGGNWSQQSSGWYVNGAGLKTFRLKGDSGDQGSIDDIKIWSQNIATIPVWSGVEENATPIIEPGANWSYNWVDASGLVMYESAVSSFWINLSWNGTNVDNVSCLLDYENGSKSVMSVLGSGINGSGFNNSMFNVSVFVPSPVVNNSVHSVRFNCSFEFYDGRLDNLTANYSQGVWWAFRVVGGNASAGYYETGSWDTAFNVTKIWNSYRLDNDSVSLVYNRSLYDDGWFFVNDDFWHQVIVLPLVIVNNSPNRYWWNFSLVYDNGYQRNFSLDYTQNLWWAYIPVVPVVQNKIETDVVSLNVNISKVMNKAGLGGRIDFWNNNRTAYLITNSSGLGVLQANVSLPLINVSSFVVNTTAYWDISWGGLQVNRSVWNVSNVTQMVLTSCNSSLTNLRALNFTLKDELSSAWLNGSVSMIWTLYRSLVGLNRTYSFEWAKNDSWGLCIYPNTDNLSFLGNAMYGATGYPLRTGIFSGIISPPVSIAYDLLLLGSSNGSKITLIVLDELNQGVMGSVVRVSKYDVGSGQYVWVGSPVMGLGGSNSIYLEMNNQHRFEVIHNGITYSNLSFVVTDTTYTFKIIINTIPDLLDWEKANRLSRTLTCNNATRSMSLVWNDTLLEVGNVCLEVYNTSASEWSNYYDACSSNESGVLGVTGLDGNNSWVGLGKVWVNGSVWTIEDCNLEAYQKEVPLGKEGLFWAIMVLMVIEVIGVAFSPVIALVLLIPYFVFVTMAGLWGIGYTILLGVVCVTILLVFALKR